MAYRVLADAVLVLHLAFIVFVVAGGLLAFRWRWATLIHLPTAAWGATIALVGFNCPLTPLENALRRAAGAQGYTGGFIEHYLLPLIYPAALTYPVQLGMAAFVVVVNALIYGAVLWRHHGNLTGSGKGKP